MTEGLKVLKSDKRAIFTAANQASKAYLYITDLAESNQSEQKAVKKRLETVLFIVQSAYNSNG
ncbi:hypothetical protein [Nitrosospira sp. Nsp1]|uniref:hypothetical protein n=1 Tax=Nitrosospira sp. Nsp1 TaxID=136547 RepID=UPI00087E24F3|nr:hypothetical protein [Nitrosospira sp. Nsp1]SCX59154.1 hypothetical protein SAMN05720354_12253 [Nitrosospira sp. Nsp1]